MSTVVSVPEMAPGTEGSRLGSRRIKDSGKAPVCPQSGNWAPGVDREISISSSVISTGTFSKRGVLR